MNSTEADAPHSQRPETPPKSAQIDSTTVDSTPHSRFSASNVYVPRITTLDDIKKQLLVDIKERKTVSMEEFAIKILGLQPDWREVEEYQALPQREAVKLAFEQYVKVATDRKQLENALYQPLVDLLNALGKKGIDPADAKVFYVQDPHYVMGYWALMKPDIGLIFQALLEEWDDNEELTLLQAKTFLEENEESVYKMSWPLMLMFTEVKHQNGRQLDPVPYPDTEAAAVAKNSVIEQSESNLGGASTQPPLTASMKRQREDEEIDATASDPPVLGEDGRVKKKARRGKKKDPAGVPPATSRTFKASGARASGSRAPPPSRMGSRSTGRVHSQPRPKPKAEPISVNLTRQQIASYGQAMLSCGKVRAHAIGMIVDDTAFRLQCYDHSGVIESEVIDITHEEYQLLFMTIIYKIHALKDDRLGFPPAFNSNYLRNSNRLKHGTWQGKGKGKEKEIGLRKGGRRRKCREEKAKPLATQPTREMIPREARAKAHARIEAMSNSSEDTTLGHEDASIHSNNSADSTYPSSTSATSATINASEENSASEDVSQLAADAEFTITSTDGAKRTFRIIEVLYTGNGVVGRGPTVYRVECIDDGVLPAGSTPWLHRVLIAKFYFPSATRTAENVLVMKARDSANKSDEWALEHLPEIIDCVDLTSIHDDSVQKRLYELLGSKSYEQRILRVSFHEPLEPLMNLKSPLELAQVIYDIVQIHQWLCEVPKILHRDISIGNIMFKRVGDKVFGVLNDFDLAFCPEYSEQPSSKHRTGTTPFMAYDLLDNDWKRGHMYRHDLESIFYVLLIVCCHYEEFGRPLPSEERPYLDWFTESATTVSKSKFKFVASPPTGPLPIQPLFEDFRDWLEDSLSQFQAGFVSKPQRRKPQDQYDWATLGGNVTYKEMNKILCLFQGTPLVRRWQGAGVSDR